VHYLPSAAIGDLQIREQVSPKDKIELGGVGASMIRPNQVVILDGGTTASTATVGLCVTILARRFGAS